MFLQILPYKIYCFQGETNKTKLNFLMKLFSQTIETKQKKQEEEKDVERNSLSYFPGIVETRRKINYSVHLQYNFNSIRNSVTLRISRIPQINN